MAKKKVTRRAAPAPGPVGYDHVAASPADPRIRKELGLDKEEEAEVVEETETEG